ncbi:hypothetical protein EBR43_07840 [bacterium]|nr:hypothetical protein [bacterium]
MKKHFFAILVLPSLVWAQTISSDSKEPMVLNFVKNDSGEIVLKLKGHKQSIEIQINGVKIASLYEQDEAANLTQAGFESAMLALDTKSGSSGSKIDAQPTVSPVAPAVFSNPFAATPY